jgi:translation initiation factor 2B subunit (eIF-2B alpha/beta/delta family)
MIDNRIVMNVFIAIIEEAYITVKMKNRNHWIYAYLKLDPKYEEIENKTHNLTSSFKEEIKPPSNRNNELSKSKEQKKVMNELTSKNILRNILNLDKIDFQDIEGAENKFEKDKKKVEANLERIFQKIEENVKELLKIGDDVSKLKDSEMKNEVMVFIYDSVNSIENKVLQIRNLILSANKK